MQNCKHLKIIYKILKQVAKLTDYTWSPTFIETIHVPSIALTTKIKAGRSLAFYH